jgi:hypothetical protein
MQVPDDLDLVVVDARGGGRLALFYAGQLGSFADCPSMTVSADGSVGDMGGGNIGTIGPLGAPVADNELRVVWAVSSGEGRSGSTQRVGQSGSSIELVSVRPAEGEPILATLADGWWSAWWPGTDRGRVGIGGFDASGELVNSLVE